MSEPLFDIAFFGIIQPGKDRQTVIDNMAKLFKTTPEKVKPFFAGGRKVIKSRVDELTAEKYRVALENAGVMQQAREVWRSLAAERPDQQGLRKQAGE